MVAKAAPFVTGPTICKDGALLEKHGMPFADVLRLEELGLLTGVSGMLALTLKTVDPQKFNSYIAGRTHALQFFGQNANHNVAINSYSITNLGQQIFGLCEVETNVDFLRDIAPTLKGSCRIPDNHIAPSRHGYLFARSVLAELLDRRRGSKTI